MVGAFKCSPVGLSNDVSFNACESFIDKQGSFIIWSLECTKHSTFIEFHLLADFLIDFIPETVLSFLDEMNFINIIEFFMDELVFLVMDWF